MDFTGCGLLRFGGRRLRSISTEMSSLLFSLFQIPKHLDKGLGDIGRERVKTFSYDYSYWSANKNDPHFTPQEQVSLNPKADLVFRENFYLNVGLHSYNCLIL